MEKKSYDRIKAIKAKISKGEPTTFAERNFLTIVTKKENRRKTKKS